MAALCKNLVGTVILLGGKSRWTSCHSCLRRAWRGNRLSDDETYTLPTNHDLRVPRQLLHYHDSDFRFIISSTSILQRNMCTASLRRHVDRHFLNTETCTQKYVCWLPHGGRNVTPNAEQKRWFAVKCCASGQKLHVPMLSTWSMSVVSKVRHLYISSLSLLTKHLQRRQSFDQPLCVLHTSPPRNWYGHPSVSPEQVNTILHRNETAVELQGDQHSSVKSFASNQVASNNPIEDRRAEARCILTKAMLFGVFDGHHGPACAQVVSERLFNYIAAEALPYNVLQHAYHMFTNGELYDLVDWSPHPNDYVSRDRQLMFRHSLEQYLRDNLAIDYQEDESVTDMLTTSFDRLDEDLSTEAFKTPSGEFNDEGLHTVFSGACACVAYVDSDNLYVANAGDCRTVLGRQNEDGTWKAVPMSNDHNAQNIEEVKRVRSNHPLEESSTVIKNGRLLSELAPLRAFGDVRFKWSQSIQHQILNPWFGANVIPRNYHTPPYLIATPEVIHHQLIPEDKFLILATDGLWDCLTPEKAIHVVGDFLLMSDKVGRFKPKSNEVSLQQIHQTLARRKAALWPRDDNAATHLIRYALGGVQHRFDHHKLANTLSLPENVVRQYRDDITVTVVFFS